MLEQCVIMALSQFLSLGPNPRYEVTITGSVALKTEQQGRGQENTCYVISSQPTFNSDNLYQ